MRARAAGATHTATRTPVGTIEARATHTATCTVLGMVTARATHTAVGMGIGTSIGLRRPKATLTA